MTPFMASASFSVSSRDVPTFNSNPIIRRRSVHAVNRSRLRLKEEAEKARLKLPEPQQLRVAVGVVRIVK